MSDQAQSSDRLNSELLNFVKKIVQQVFATEKSCWKRVTLFKTIFAAANCKINHKCVIPDMIDKNLELALQQAEVLLKGAEGGHNFHQLVAECRHFDVYCTKSEGMRELPEEVPITNECICRFLFTPRYETNGVA